MVGKESRRPTATLGPVRHAYPMGASFKVRIADDVRRCVVFFGHLDDTPGKGGINCIGTGFLLEHGGLTYLVTAAHLAHSLGDDPFILRVNKSDGTSENAHIDSAWWFYHSDPTVDLAVSVIFLDPKEGYDSIYLGGETLELTREQLQTENIGIGSLTYAVGLFRLMSGEKRNLPVCHAGSIALFPGDQRIPVLDWRDGTQTKVTSVDGFLVETHSLQGLSGSPVFVRPETGLDPSELMGLGLRGLRPKESRKIIWPRVQLRLLGLWQGSWDAPPDQVMVTQTRATGSARVPVGMGVVVPCYHIIDLLEQDDVKRHRIATINAYHPQLFALEHGQLSNKPINGDATEEVFAPVTDAVKNINRSTLFAQTALICDSIYVDVFGKEILVGVYSNFYFVPKLPASARVCLYIRVSGQALGTYDVEYRAVGPFGAMLLSPYASKVTLQAGHDYALVTFVDLNLHIQSPGSVKFQWRFNKDDDWGTLTSFEVRLISPAQEWSKPDGERQS